MAENCKYCKMTRADLRGKPLDSDCRKANTSRGERGADDMRVFCYGRADGMTDELLDKCRRCGALAWNETPDVGRLSDG